jgi:hypothetical protein
MRRLAFPLTVGAAMLVVLMLVLPAHAQLRHTWVASDGLDAASCDRPTPCATFSGALGKTAAGGEITCVDSGNFTVAAIFTINKSITINCESTLGSNTAIGGTFFGAITVATAASDVVILRGLDLDGLGAICSGTCGTIEFTGAGTLYVDKVKINKVSGDGKGIRFAPSGPARLDVSDSFIASMGTNLSTAGILIRPVMGAGANVSVSRVHLKGNVNGIFVDGSGGGGAVNLEVHDSVVTGNSNVGIVVATPGPAVSAMIDRTTVTSSLNVGVAVSGAAATVRIGNSTIYGNVTGVATFAGGTLRSYKNNQINGNLADGTPITAEGLN